MMYGYLETPLGTARVQCTNAVVGLDWVAEAGVSDEDPIIERALRELDEYFLGERTHFTMPLALEGSPFQQHVWHTLQKIPYGQTRTYRDVAVMIGKPQAMRAVGQANNKNPLPIFIPCHRVIGAHNLGGYAGGDRMKRWLLRHEKHYKAEHDKR